MLSVALLICTNLNMRRLNNSKTLQDIVSWGSVALMILGPVSISNICTVNTSWLNSTRIDYLTSSRSWLKWIGCHGKMQVHAFKVEDQGSRICCSLSKYYEKKSKSISSVWFVLCWLQWSTRRLQANPFRLDHATNHDGMRSPSGDSLIWWLPLLSLQKKERVRKTIWQIEN